MDSNDGEAVNNLNDTTAVTQLINASNGTDHSNGWISLNVESNDNETPIISCGGDDQSQINNRTKETSITYASIDGELAIQNEVSEQPQHYNVVEEAQEHDYGGENERSIENLSRAIPENDKIPPIDTGVSSEKSSSIIDLQKSKHSIESTYLDLVDGLSSSTGKSRSLSTLPSIEEVNEEDSENSLLFQPTFPSASSSLSSLPSSANLFYGNVVQGVSSKPTLTSITEESRVGFEDALEQEEENKNRELELANTLFRTEAADNGKLNDVVNSKEEAHLLIESKRGRGDFPTDIMLLDTINSKMVDKQPDFPGGEGHFELQDKIEHDLSMLPSSDIIVNVLIQQIFDNVASHKNTQENDNTGEGESRNDCEGKNNQDRKCDEGVVEDTTACSKTKTPEEDVMISGTSQLVDDRTQKEETDCCMLIGCQDLEPIHCECEPRFEQTNSDRETTEFTEKDYICVKNDKQIVSKSKNHMPHGQSKTNETSESILDGSRNNELTLTDMTEIITELLPGEGKKHLNDLKGESCSGHESIQSSSIAHNAVLETYNTDESNHLIDQDGDDEKKAATFSKAKGSGSDSKVNDTTSSNCDISSARESYSEHTMSSANSEKQDKDGNEKETQKQRDKDKDRDRDGNKRKRERFVEEASTTVEMKECLKNAVGDVCDKLSNNKSIISGPYMCEIRGSETKTTCRLEWQIAGVANDSQSAESQMDRIIQQISDTSDQIHDTIQESDSISDSIIKNKPRSKKRKNKRKKKQLEPIANVNDSTSHSHNIALHEAETDTLDACDSPNCVASSLSVSQSEDPSSSEVSEHTSQNRPVASTNHVSLINEQDHTIEVTLEPRGRSEIQKVNYTQSETLENESRRELDTEAEIPFETAVSNTEFLSELDPGTETFITADDLSVFNTESASVALSTQLCTDGDTRQPEQRDLETGKILVHVDSHNKKDKDHTLLNARQGEDIMVIDQSGKVGSEYYNSFSEDQEPVITNKKCSEFQESAATGKVVKTRALGTKIAASPANIVGEICPQFQEQFSENLTNETSVSKISVDMDSHDSASSKPLDISEESEINGKTENIRDDPISTCEEYEKNELYGVTETVREKSKDISDKPSNGENICAENEGDEKRDEIRFEKMEIKLPKDCREQNVNEKDDIDYILEHKEITSPESEGCLHDNHEDSASEENEYILSDNVEDLSSVKDGINLYEDEEDNMHERVDKILSIALDDGAPECCTQIEGRGQNGEVHDINQREENVLGKGEVNICEQSKEYLDRKNMAITCGEEETLSHRENNEKTYDKSEEEISEGCKKSIAGQSGQNNCENSDVGIFETDQSKVHTNDGITQLGEYENIETIESGENVCAYCNGINNEECEDVLRCKRKDHSFQKWDENICEGHAWKSFGDYTNEECEGSQTRICHEEQQNICGVNEDNRCGGYDNHIYGQDEDSIREEDEDIVRVEGKENVRWVRKDNMCGKCKDSVCVGNINSVHGEGRDNVVYESEDTMKGEKIDKVNEEGEENVRKKARDIMGRNSEDNACEQSEDNTREYTEDYACGQGEGSLIGKCEVIACKENEDIVSGESDDFGESKDILCGEDIVSGESDDFGESKDILCGESEVNIYGEINDIGFREGGDKEGSNAEDNGYEEVKVHEEYDDPLRGKEYCICGKEMSRDDLRQEGLNEDSVDTESKDKACKRYEDYIHGKNEDSMHEEDESQVLKRGDQEHQCEGGDEDLYREDKANICEEGFNNRHERDGDNLCKEDSNVFGEAVDTLCVGNKANLYGEESYNINQVDEVCLDKEISTLKSDNEHVILEGKINLNGEDDSVVPARCEDNNLGEIQDIAFRESKNLHEDSQNDTGIDDGNCLSKMGDRSVYEGGKDNFFGEDKPEEECGIDNVHGNCVENLYEEGECDLRVESEEKISGVDDGREDEDGIYEENEDSLLDKGDENIFRKDEIMHGEDNDSVCEKGEDNIWREHEDNDLGDNEDKKSRDEDDKIYKKGECIVCREDEWEYCKPDGFNVSEKSENSIWSVNGCDVYGEDQGKVYREGGEEVFEVQENNACRNEDYNMRNEGEDFVFGGDKNEEYEINDDTDNKCRVSEDEVCGEGEDNVCTKVEDNVRGKDKNNISEEGTDKRFEKVENNHCEIGGVKFCAEVEDIISGEGVVNLCKQGDVNLTRENDCSLLGESKEIMSTEFEKEEIGKVQNKSSETRKMQTNVCTDIDIMGGKWVADLCNERENIDCRENDTGVCGEIKFDFCKEYKGNTLENVRQNVNDDSERILFDMGDDNGGENVVNSEEGEFKVGLFGESEDILNKHVKENISKEDGRKTYEIECNAEIDVKVCDTDEDVRKRNRESISAGAIVRENECNVFGDDDVGIYGEGTDNNCKKADKDVYGEWGKNVSRGSEDDKCFINKNIEKEVLRYDEDQKECENSEFEVYEISADAEKIESKENFCGGSKQDAYLNGKDLMFGEKIEDEYIEYQNDECISCGRHSPAGIIENAFKSDENNLPEVFNENNFEEKTNHIDIFENDTERIFSINETKYQERKEKINLNEKEVFCESSVNAHEIKEEHDTITTEMDKQQRSSETTKPIFCEDQETSLEHPQEVNRTKSPSLGESTSVSDEEDETRGHNFDLLISEQERKENESAQNPQEGQTVGTRKWMNKEHNATTLTKTTDEHILDGEVNLAKYELHDSTQATIINNYFECKDQECFQFPKQMEDDESVCLIEETKDQHVSPEREFHENEWDKSESKECFRELLECGLENISADENGDKKDNLNTMISAFENQPSIEIDRNCEKEEEEEMQTKEEEETEEEEEENETLKHTSRQDESSEEPSDENVNVHSDTVDTPYDEHNPSSFRTMQETQGGDTLDIFKLKNVFVDCCREKQERVNLIVTGPGGVKVNLNTNKESDVGDSSKQGNASKEENGTNILSDKNTTIGTSSFNVSEIGSSKDNYYLEGSSRHEQKVCDESDAYRNANIREKNDSVQSEDEDSFEEYINDLVTQPVEEKEDNRSFQKLETTNENREPESKVLISQDCRADLSEVFLEYKIKSNDMIEHTIEYPDDPQTCSSERNYKSTMSEMFVENSENEITHGTSTLAFERVDNLSPRSQPQRSDYTEEFNSYRPRAYDQENCPMYADEGKDSSKISKKAQSSSTTDDVTEGFSVVDRTETQENSESIMDQRTDKTTNDYIHLVDNSMISDGTEAISHPVYDHFEKEQTNAMLSQSGCGECITNPIVSADQQHQCWKEMEVSEVSETLAYCPADLRALEHHKEQQEYDETDTSQLKSLLERDNDDITATEKDGDYEKGRSLKESFQVEGTENNTYPESIDDCLHKKATNSVDSNDESTDVCFYVRGSSSTLTNPVCEKDDIADLRHDAYDKHETKLSDNTCDEFAITKNSDLDLCTEYTDNQEYDDDNKEKDPFRKSVKAPGQLDDGAQTEQENSELIEMDREFNDTNEEGTTESTKSPVETQGVSTEKSVITDTLTVQCDKISSVTDKEKSRSIETEAAISNLVDEERVSSIFTDDVSDSKIDETKEGGGGVSLSIEEKPEEILELIDEVLSGHSGPADTDGENEETIHTEDEGTSKQLTTETSTLGTYGKEQGEDMVLNGSVTEKEDPSESDREELTKSEYSQTTILLNESESERLQFANNLNKLKPQYPTSEVTNEDSGDLRQKIDVEKYKISDTEIAPAKKGVKMPKKVDAPTSSKNKSLWRKVVARLQHPRSYRRSSTKHRKRAASDGTGGIGQLEINDESKEDNEIEMNDDGWKTLERDALPPSSIKRRPSQSKSSGYKYEWRRFRRLKRMRNGAEKVPEKLPPVRRPIGVRNIHKPYTGPHTSYDITENDFVMGVNERRLKGKTRRKRSDLLLHGHIKEVEITSEQQIPFTKTDNVFEVYCDKDKREVSDLAGSLANKETPPVRLLMKPLMSGMNAQTSQQKDIVCSAERMEPTELIDETPKTRIRPSKRISCVVM